MSKKRILSFLCGTLLLPLGAAPVAVDWYNGDSQLEEAKKIDAEIVKEGDTLKVKGGEKRLFLAQDKKIEVVPGSLFRMHMDVKGKGTFGIAVQVFDEDGKLLETLPLSRKIGSKPTVLDDYVRIKATHKKKTPAFATAGLYIYPKSEGTISNINIQFEKEPTNPTLMPLRRTDWAQASYAVLTKKAKTEKNIPLMFLGDSITFGWSTPADNRYPGGREIWDKTFQPFGAINFGISGDRVEHVLWRITEGEQLACKPKVLVLLIGTNNFSRALPQEIAAGIDNLLKVIREKSPDTKVLLLGIFPRRGVFPVAETNELLVDVAARNKVEFLNINEALLQGKKEVSKEIFRDGLHLSPQGYEVFAAQLLPKVNEMLEKVRNK